MHQGLGIGLHSVLATLMTTLSLGYFRLFPRWKLRHDKLIKTVGCKFEYHYDILITMYERLVRQNGNLLRLEVGLLSEMSCECCEIQRFLESADEEHDCFENIPLADCWVRKYSNAYNRHLLHRNDGPALQIENLVTGHVYFRVYAEHGRRQDQDGPALLADDTIRQLVEHYQNGAPFDSNGAFRKIIENGLVVDEVWADTPSQLDLQSTVPPIP